MMRGSSSTTALLMAMKAASRDPQSWTITSLTDFAVVKGPGVRSNGSPVSDVAREITEGMHKPLKAGGRRDGSSVAAIGLIYYLDACHRLFLWGPGCRKLP